jgi:hypothetical protein
MDICATACSIQVAHDGRQPSDLVPDKAEGGLNVSLVQLNSCEAIELGDRYAAQVYDVAFRGLRI